MQSVLTLIRGAEPATNTETNIGTILSDTIVSDVRAALNGLGAETAAPDWLAPGAACDLAFDNISEDQADAASRHVLGDVRIDVVAQPIEGRRKKLLLADMDSTIVTGETLDDLAAYAGLKDQISAITARAMNGELDFEDALRERVGMLKGLAESTLEDAWGQVELTPGAAAMVATMAASGAHCVLISGGFKFFTARVRDLCGFHEDLSNNFVIEDGKLTGVVTEPILNKDVKQKTLIARAAELGLALSDTLAVGDGANDLPMLQVAGLGIAFRGKPSVRVAAPARLDHADLTGLLYAQGFRADSFVH